MKVVKARQMQEIDRLAIKDYAIPGIVLMENAGMQVVNAMEEEFDSLDLASIVIIAGKGNNGGDGFVVARHLFNLGYSVSLVVLADLASFKGDAKTNCDIVKNLNIPMLIIPDLKSCDKTLHHILNHADIVVDALFGTGLTSPPRKQFAEIIERVNNSRAFIVAVDIPSGLDPDRGLAFEPCIEADLTVTFGLPKLGQILYPGASYCGELVIADISFPHELIESCDVKISLLMDYSILEPLQIRKPDSHKGTFGHLFALTGSQGKTGAACLVAESAVRMGTGLVTVGIPKSLNHILEVKLTEAMTLPLAETKENTIAMSAVPAITEVCKSMSALAIGPGISGNSETWQVITKLILEIDLPMVIDADGLNALAFDISILKKRKNELCVLTPHPGEMARLLGITTDEVQNNRIDTAVACAEKTDCIVVLKGARSIIATPQGFCDINMTGNSGLASGGTGDVLTGIIGALLAQNYSALDAARMGTMLHGMAADNALEHSGEVSLTARDVIRELSGVFLEL